VTATADPVRGTPAALLARHAADPARVFAVVEDDRGGTVAISYAQQLSRARHVAQFLGGGLRPGGQQDGAEQRGGEPGVEELRAVRGVQMNPIAGLDAQGGERARHGPVGGFFIPIIFGHLVAHTSFDTGWVFLAIVTVAFALIGLAGRNAASAAPEPAMMPASYAAGPAGPRSTEEEAV